MIFALSSCGSKPREVVMTQPNGTYELSESGEAIVNDIDLSAYEASDDNAPEKEEQDAE